MKLFSYASICIFLISACTENPFFDDKIEVKENLVIRGTVMLSDNTIPSNIYVWLEGFNLSSWTNTDGEFSIELPPAKSQVGDGLNGIYYLYAYTANYQYQKFDMLLLDGEFKYDSKHLDSNGNFKQNIVLEKILDINTSILPATINSTYMDPIDISIRLESLVDSVIVKTLVTVENKPSCMVFIEQNASSITEAILIQNRQPSLKSIVIKDIVNWSVPLIFPAKVHGEGIYRAWPYLQIIQEGLPQELLLSIDENIFETNYHYLNWPIKQYVGYLIVDNNSNE